MFWTVLKVLLFCEGLRNAAKYEDTDFPFPADSKWKFMTCVGSFSMQLSRKKYVERVGELSLNYAAMLFSYCKKM